jgi:hypothetical protein
MRGTGNVVFFIPKRIQEGCRTCRLCSFQRKFKRGTGHVVFAHSNEDPREAQNMSSLFITKRAGLACTGLIGHILSYTPSPSKFHQLMHKRVRK